MATYAYNTKEGSSTQKVHHKGIGFGYRITANGKTIYHAGDTDFIPKMKQIGPIDMALLPIGGTYTMDINKAVKAAMTIKPATVIPMHHLKSNPQEFQKKFKSPSDIKVLLPQIGETYQLIT
jgi:L-ascorbate metabolism protein UlaG (beta-lactamase superfamily)